jgi:hypothetical protein
MTQAQIKSLAREIVENYINGNISDACAAFKDLPPYTAAVLAVEVYSKLEDTTAFERTEPGSFFRAMRNRVEE